MVTAQKRSKAPKLGKQDRWPSDYGVRDAEHKRTDDGATEEDGSWTHGEKGHGGEGRSKGYGGRGGKGRGGRDPIRVSAPGAT
jgi:hypothetical protein